MCGICGWVAPAGAQVDPEAGRRMNEALLHRGPDGEGEVLLEGRPGGPQAWIGHRRLSIIDLSTRASQPMLSRDGSIALTYNGEIYNFRELRRELETMGASFESDGDTEVVLRAYEAWGDECVRRIDGMFALAVWDGREDRLLLARDRTGKKPLFYAADGDRIAFGSELKAVLACPWVPRRPDFSRLGEFLTFGYVPHPATFYEGIEQVPPAGIVVFDRNGLHPTREYWDALPAPRGGDRLRPGEEFSRGVAERLLAATERRMIADVPLGALLSGGIDSSLVVGLMAKVSPDPVHTFSIGFADDASFDEREHARAVAEHFSTRHVDFEVRLDAVGLMDRLLWHHDQPYADSSAIPTFIVSKLAREHVKVVLNGDGGDEVFGGYDRFRAAALSRRLPSPLARGARRVAGLLPVDHGYYSVRRRAERFLELADASIEDRYQSWISVANPDLLRELVAPRWLDGAGSPLASMDRYYDRVRDRPPLDRILYANFKTYLPDDLAVKMDRMSMANSLEARSPFLDTALIEHLARLPARHKVGLRRLKPVLRDALGPMLPDAIWDRRKHGFGVPMGTWFRGELGTLFEDEVLAPGARCADVLQPGTVRRLYDEQRAGTRENGFRLWTLLTLERWLRSLERPLEVRPPGESAVADAGERALS